MIDNREELNHIIKYIDITKYIIQPYISGDIITVDVVRNMSTNKSCAIARKELLRTKNGAGTSVYVFNDKKIEKVACEIAELLNINGCVNFEFIKNNDRIYFIECNPRFSGGVEFSCLAGYDMIINHIKCFQCIDIDSKKYINNQFIARKYEEYITKIEKVNE